MSDRNERSVVRRRKRKLAKNWRRLGIIGSSNVILVKRHTHYPVPGNVKASVKVSKGLRKIMTIFVLEYIPRRLWT